MGCCCESESAGFCQWETADLVLEVDRDGALVNTADVIVSLVQDSERIDYHKQDLLIDEDAGEIALHINQGDSGKFRISPVYLQVNILYESGERIASEVAEANIYGNLYRQEMA